MDKNVKLLSIGLLIFGFSIILRAANAIDQLISSIVMVIGFIFVIIPLYRLVFKKLNK